MIIIIIITITIIIAALLVRPGSASARRIDAPPIVPCCLCEDVALVTHDDASYCADCAIALAVWQ